LGKSYPAWDRGKTGKKSSAGEKGRTGVCWKKITGLKKFKSDRRQKGRLAAEEGGKKGEKVQKQKNHYVKK